MLDAWLGASMRCLDAGRSALLGGAAEVASRRFREVVPLGVDRMWMTEHTDSAFLGIPLY